MARRPQVTDPNAQRIKLTPRATPVDQFIRPQGVAPDPSVHFHLAEALATINPNLQKFLQQTKKEGDAEDEAEGARLFAENRVKFAEAVRQGLLPAGANPHLQRGYRMAQLRNSATDFDTALRNAYTENGGPDIGDIEGFAKEFYKQNREGILGDGFTDDEYFNAFQPMFERSIANLKQQHSAEKVKMFEERRLNEFDMEVVKAIDTVLDGGGDWDLDLSGDSSKGLAALISERAKELIGEGVPAKTVNETLRRAIIAKAEDEQDPSLLSLMDEIKTGTGYLGQTSESRKAREVAEDRILSEIAATERAEAKAIEDARKVRKAELGGLATGIVLMNPKTPDEVRNQQRAYSRLVATMIKEGYHELARTMEGFRRATDGERADPRPNGTAMLQAMQELFQPGADALSVAAKYQGILPSSDLKDLVRMAESRRRNPGIFGERAYSQIEQRLSGIVTGSADQETDAKRMDAFNAVELLNQMVAREAERLGVTTLTPELRMFAHEKAGQIAKTFGDQNSLADSKPYDFLIENRPPRESEILLLTPDRDARIIFSIDEGSLDPKAHLALIKLKRQVRNTNGKPTGTSDRTSPAGGGGRPGSTGNSPGNDRTGSGSGNPLRDTDLGRRFPGRLPGE